MKIDCPHWSRERDRGQGVCALGRYDGRPWPRNCLDCLARGENASGPPAKPADWPLLLRALKLLARPDDQGMGDIVARVVGPVGGEAFKAWHRRFFGQDCGCGKRQEALNARYPL